MARPRLQIKPNVQQKTTLKTKLSWISAGIVALSFAAFFILTTHAEKKVGAVVTAETESFSESELVEASTLSEASELSSFSATETESTVAAEVAVSEANATSESSAVKAAEKKEAKKSAASAAVRRLKSVASVASTQKAASSASASSVQYAQVATQLMGTAGQVSWTTAYQVNSEKFEIERSYDGHNFEKLGEVKAAGTLSKPQSYSYLDQTLIEAQMPRVYYRVSQIGMDKKVAPSEPIEHRLNLDLGLYTKVIKEKSGKLKIQYASDEDESVKLRVMDVAGQTLEEHELTSSLKPKMIDLKSDKFEKGNYYLQVYTETSSAMELFEVK